VSSGVSPEWEALFARQKKSGGTRTQKQRARRCSGQQPEVTRSVPWRRGGGFRPAISRYVFLWQGAALAVWNERELPLVDLR
jgi:hypothetical protein